MADRPGPVKAFETGKKIIFFAMVAVAGLGMAAFHSGWSKEAAHEFLRLSGRLALALFIASFGASTLQRLFRAGWTRFLVIHRRYLGIATALTLWVHFTVILSLIAFEKGWQEANAPLSILIPGASTFVLVGLMALTSNAISQERLGKKNWRRLHLVGGYAALLAFIYEYVLQLFLTPEGMVPTLHPAISYMLLITGSALLVLRLMKGRLARRVPLGSR
ncbi:MAG: ferric reductase-like transmembrane domain-containing protein [Myxococcota bacterium]|jgi:methionine sulfoxide reductase heme-binding subunit|nr:ferric reductase-like transmembrane domain-containing protein [Myxococcota bacterium]